MTLGEGLVKALYFSVGAIAVGVEAVAGAADDLIAKGSDVVTQGKSMVKDAIAKAKKSDNAAPADEAECEDCAEDVNDPVED